MAEIERNLDEVKVEQVKEQKVEGESKFRLNCRQLFLTYPKMENSKEEVLEALRAKKLDIRDYIVSRELHEDGTPHIHVYLCLNSVINYKDPKCLDILGQHGSYESTRSRKATLKYLAKGGDFITNLHVLDNEILDIEQYLLNLAHRGLIEEAKVVLKNSTDPRLLRNYTI